MDRNLGIYLAKIWELKKQTATYIEYEEIKNEQLPVIKKRGRPKKNK
jgi:hypothetical protein